MNPSTETTRSARGADNSLVEAAAVKKAALTLRALNHKLRQAIVDLINEKGKITVTEIYVKLRLEQSVASQHLAILRRANFVKTQRDGKFIHYSLNTEYIKHVVRLANEIIK